MQSGFQSTIDSEHSLLFVKTYLSFLKCLLLVLCNPCIAMRA